MIKTPRTDECWSLDDGGEIGLTAVRMLTLCRVIETELATANERIAELTTPPGFVSVPKSVADFAAKVICESRESLSDLDGGWLQDTMVECGVLQEYTVIESCGDECVCADYGFPSECYRSTPEVKTFLTARTTK